jgi:uncharacterized protein (DUF305 family)
MNEKPFIIMLLLLSSLTACVNQTGNNSKLKSDTAKSDVENGNEDTTIKSAFVNTVLLLRDRNDDMNNDRRFAKIMVYCNQGVLSISKVFLRKSNNEQLKKFVKARIDKRSEETAEMHLFLKSEPGEKSSTSKDFESVVNSAIFKLDTSSKTGDNKVDVLFINSVVPLLQCIVTAAEAEGMYGSHQTLKIHARNIISSKKEEISWIQEWLKKNQL